MNRRSFVSFSAAALSGLQVSRDLFGSQLAVPKQAMKLRIGHPLADPFCMKWGQFYYLTGTYSTGRPAKTGQAFDLLRSTDLIEWKSLGPVLRIPDYEGSRQANYWAPEILPHRGKFHLYFTSDSFGDAYRRFVRVAIADNIEGPYESDGRPLTGEPSIDGHPFYSSDREGYLFYTGNEGNPHMGQVLVDRLVSPNQLAGKPRKVFPSETVEWEEGAFLLRKNGEFYLFSSQGNWRNATYHILVAKSKTVAGPYQRIFDADDRKVLETNEHQIGPGHNSLFDGPGGLTYVCYHAWDQAHTGRYAWIAPLFWDNDFPLVGETRC